MGRLTRAQRQQLNRAEVLAAAKQEFAERGFHDARIDDIAERAGLTRGAVYSNFPGKRALYFAVQADDAEHSVAAAQQPPAQTAHEALGGFARTWVTRLPLSPDEPRSGLAGGMTPEILADDRTRRSFAQLMKLGALLLGLGLEGLPHPAKPTRRRVRLAETVLTTLYGATQLSTAAPGFLEPFDVTTACERLADADLDDTWPPPHTPHLATETRAVDEPWAPPEATDLVRREPAHLGDNHVVAVLGVHRLAAVEEAVRAAPAGTLVTAVLVSGAAQELMPLARLVVSDLCVCLRGSFPPSTIPDLQVVCDESGAVAAAAGLPAVTDTTESAVCVDAGRVVTRADGLGACHVVARARGVDRRR